MGCRTSRTALVQLTSLKCQPKIIFFPITDIFLLVRSFRPTRALFRYRCAKGLCLGIVGCWGFCSKTWCATIHKHQIHLFSCDDGSRETLNDNFLRASYSIVCAVNNQTTTTYLSYIKYPVVWNEKKPWFWKSLRILCSKCTHIFIQMTPWPRHIVFIWTSVICPNVIVHNTNVPLKTTRTRGIFFRHNPHRHSQTSFLFFPDIAKRILTTCQKPPGASPGGPRPKPEHFLSVFSSSLPAQSIAFSRDPQNSRWSSWLIDSSMTMKICIYHFISVVY